MATTANFNLWSPDDGDDWDLTIDLAAMMNSVDLALLNNISKSATTIAGLGSGTTQGQIGLVTNANAIVSWNGTGWVALRGQRVANSGARNALYPSPITGDLVYRTDLGYEESYDAASTSWLPVISLARRQRNTTNSVIAPLIQVGTGFVTGNNTASVTKAITFPVGFKTGTVPAVTTSALGFRNTGAFNDSGLSVGAAIASAAAPSATGFTENFSAITGTLGTAFDYYFSWIAIGEAP